MSCGRVVGRKEKSDVALIWRLGRWDDTLYPEKHQHVFVDLSERGEEYIDYIPGLSPMKVADFPVVDRGLQHILPNLVSVSKKAQSLLLSTVYELEPEAINAIKNKFQVPVYAIGPNIPEFQLKPTLPQFEPNYISWLDSKPPKSVLYISLGSYLSVSNTQMDEMLVGLKQSGVNFLWVARKESLRLSEKCGSNGIMVEWCDQLRVLLHSSIGGFFSHCEWNSIKESVFSGVPVLCFSITGEQVINSKVVVDGWKNGWKVNMKEFAVVVKRFMDLDCVERREMMERVEKLKGVCRESARENGSASRDINCFIRDNFASKQR